MSPQPCHRCVLQESRDGRVCPAAREVYGLPDVETERHAAALHAAILADAQGAPGFAELVRRDAIRQPQVQLVRDVPAILADLERGGALSSFQAQRLLASWWTQKDDWASSPFFRNVGEHSQSYIDQLRAESSPISTTTTQRSPITHV